MSAASERAVPLVNLVLAGVLTGNEFGGWAAVHPALDGLPGRTRLPAEQAVYRRYGRIMPFLMVATVASGVAAAGGTPDRSSAQFRLRAAGTGCFASMVAITLAGNLPINAEIVALPDDESGYSRLGVLRKRWDRLHTARNALNFAGFALTAAAALPSEA